ncbi:hypothetical protein [Candidatus Phyllobacterium onerii]|uniref:hypothetical protein n=1 Tax=Candidatus Phyllobacterium onerii TaxID=3020828 RepID=UPI0023301BFC|nr:hypothetical protein [Phyllobacterium sp. IY22]
MKKRNLWICAFALFGASFLVFPDAKADVNYESCIRRLEQSVSGKDILHVPFCDKSPDGKTNVSSHWTLNWYETSELLSSRFSSLLKLANGQSLTLTATSNPNVWTVSNPILRATAAGPSVVPGYENITFLAVAISDELYWVRCNRDAANMCVFYTVIYKVGALSDGVSCTVDFSHHFKQPPDYSEFYRIIQYAKAMADAASQNKTVSSELNKACFRGNSK